MTERSIDNRDAARVSCFACQIVCNVNNLLLDFSLFQMSEPNDVQTFLRNKKMRTKALNIKLMEKLPHFLETIASWGSERQLSQTFEDYLRKVRKMSDGDLEEVFSSDREKLQQTNFDGLNVTFVSSLLPLICEDIEHKSDTSNEDRIECQLTKMKELSTQVMNEPEGKALDPTVAIEVKAIAMKMLDIAGKTYSKGAKEINEAKEEVKKIFTEAQAKVKKGMEQQTIQSQPLWQKQSLPKPREQVRKLEKQVILN